MKKFIDAADKFTQYALAAVLTLFAVACMFSSCKVDAKNATTTTAATTQEIRTVEEIRPEVLDMGTFRMTAYCPCEICCGNSADGITATGTKATAGRTIAVDEDVIPYGSEVIINGHTYTAEDCGGAIIGKEVDIFFDTHEEAEAFGVHYQNVYLLVGDTDVYN